MSMYRQIQRQYLQENLCADDFAEACLELERQEKLPPCPATSGYHFYVGDVCQACGSTPPVIDDEPDDLEP